MHWQDMILPGSTNLYTLLKKEKPIVQIGVVVLFGFTLVLGIWMGGMLAKMF